MNRYARQTILPQVGLSGQSALKNSKVLIVGAGGLGLPCAQSLVAAGVGQISVIDDDRVCLTNLQRQFLFNESDIGRYKADVLLARLSAQNSDVKIRAITDRLNIKNALDLITEHDLIIDGSDNFATKFLINDACLLKKIPWVYGSVSRFEGQVAVFTSKGSQGGHSCYRCLYEKTPVSKIENCAEQGVLGAVTGIVGNYQALEALKILIKLKSENPENAKNLLEAKTNFLQVFDFQSLEQQSLFIPKRQTCPCHEPEKIVLKEEITDHLCVSEAQKTWNEFEQDRQKKVLFDVRTIEEFLAGHHKQGQLWNSDVESRIIRTDLKDTGAIYFYCATGQRAKSKCREFRARGFSAYYITGQF